MRSSLVLRPATAADAEQLALLWVDIMRRAEHAEQVADIHRLLDEAALDPQLRLVVAEYDGVVAGAVALRIATATVVNLEPVVQAVSPHVFPHFRGHGIGTALVEAAVSFAEERDIGHVGSGALSSSREANRFLARLGLGPVADMRVAPTHVVRAKLQSIGGTRRGDRRQLSQVLAARRRSRRREPETAG
ncbi:MAG: GNAT family N-acetyltransferase [Nocardioides sp.]